MMSVAHTAQVIGPGLGASEVCAALGLHPYRSPLALWEEKCGEREPFAGNDFTEWGLLVEGPLLKWYERRLDGRRLHRLAGPGQKRQPVGRSQVGQRPARRGDPAVPVGDVRLRVGSR